MAKSNEGSGDRPDGRRNNRPPEHGKIKAGEVRNRWGRAGKPKPRPASTMDELLCEMGSRTVSHDDDGPVDARKRLLQEEFHAALKDGDSAVRARLLTQLSEAGARIEHDRREQIAWFFEMKVEMEERFQNAKRLNLLPPDAFHPNHLHIQDGSILITGPIDKEARTAWEWVKAAIRVAACLHDLARQEYRRTNCTDVLDDLRAMEKHRRKLMRCVPKSWNWKEEIYCRDSRLKFAKEIVQKLREIGYEPSDA